MNHTTQTFPRTSRLSGTEYAASIEIRRRTDTSGRIIAFVFCVAVLASGYFLGWGAI